VGDSLERVVKSVDFEIFRPLLNIDEQDKKLYADSAYVGKELQESMLEENPDL